MTRFPKARNNLKTTERGFLFRLCREQFPGHTVAEMLEHISSSEIVEWMAWTEVNDKAQKDAAAKK
jgi:hypothetical protein